jgi:hypothetical protein
VPFGSAGWAGQQQYNQHQNRRDENRYDERSQKTDPALAAAQRRKKTENEVYDDANRYGHYAIFLPLKLSSLSLAQLESGHLDQMCQVFRNSTINPSLRTRESRGRQSAW